MMLAQVLRALAETYCFCDLFSNGFSGAAGCLSGCFEPFVCPVGGFAGGKLGEAILEPGAGVMTPFACLFLYADRLIFFFGPWLPVLDACDACDLGRSGAGSSSSPATSSKQS